MHLLRQTVRRPHGYLVSAGDDGAVERDTLQCVHCNCHFTVQPGSGTERGFCGRCFGPTCGRGGCDVCIPFERKLEEIERRDALRRSVEEAMRR